MTRAEAVKKLQRIYGAAAAYRVDLGARDQADREAAHAEHLQVKTEWEAVGKAMTARAAELVAADEQYQTLKAEYEKLKAKKATLLGTVMSHRFTAGFTAHGFFHVDAHGDTWGQVFTKLKEKYPNGKR